jgi:hypothetical protein
LSSELPSAKVPGLRFLCLFLGFAGLLFLGISAWLFVSGQTGYAIGSLAAGALTAASGWGLFRLRRWGVILFGLLSLAGSVNHLARTLFRYSDLSAAGVCEIAGALFSILLAILVPLGLFYVTLTLWRKAT